MREKRRPLSARIDDLRQLEHGRQCHGPEGACMANFFFIFQKIRRSMCHRPDDFFDFQSKNLDYHRLPLEALVVDFFDSNDLNGKN